MRRSSRVRIIPANLRDVSWITANLRPADRAEVFAQLDCSTTELAYYLTQGESFVATLDGHPVLAFGTGELGCTAVSVWALGTIRCTRVIPEVSRFFMNVILPSRLKRGCRWAEARSIASHTVAHRWLERMGGEAVLRMPDYGRNGEEFILFRWTRAQFEAVS